MTVHDLKNMRHQPSLPGIDKTFLNSLHMSKAACALSGKLEELGVAELRWHSTLSTYQTAVANSYKRVVGEYFSEDLNILPPNRFFGLTGHDETGQTICTVASRYDDVTGWDLHQYIHQFWRRNYRGKNGEHAILRPESVSFAQEITGPFGYIGDMAVDQAVARKGVGKYFGRFALLATYMEWRPAYLYAWMANRHVAAGLAFRWGFSVTCPFGFKWDNPPENEAYSDLCFVGCPPQAIATIVRHPLEIGALPSDRVNSKA